MTAPRVVVMGVSGCGKSTVGRALAHALGVAYVEGDEWHPPRNVQKMAAGTPLTDDDRRDWLDALAGRLGVAHVAGQGVVLSCSALKRSYRDRLRAQSPGLRFVFLHGSPDLLARRMQARTGHYMPPSLLQSQLDTLEPPAADEDAVAADIGQAPEAIVAAVRQRLLPAEAAHRP